MAYGEIARRIDVPLCEGPMCEWGDVRRHQKGSVERTLALESDTVHWFRDRVTRSGIYEFLKLCSAAKNRENQDLEPAFRLYANSIWALNTARDLGIMIPSLVTRYDRLRVRSLLGPDIPSTAPIYKWVHKETI